MNARHGLNTVALIFVVMSIMGSMPTLLPEDKGDNIISDVFSRSRGRSALVWMYLDNENQAHSYMVNIKPLLFILVILALWFMSDSKEPESDDSGSEPDSEDAESDDFGSDPDSVSVSDSEAVHNGDVDDNPKVLYVGSPFDTFTRERRICEYPVFEEPGVKEDFIYTIVKLFHET